LFYLKIIRTDIDLNIKDVLNYFFPAIFSISIDIEYKTNNMLINAVTPDSINKLVRPLLKTNNSMEIIKNIREIEKQNIFTDFLLIVQ
jgi:hypothetical protein